MLFHLGDGHIRLHEWGLVYLPIPPFLRDFTTFTAKWSHVDENVIA